MLITRKLFAFISFREHKQSMVRLKKLLSDTSKARRHRRIILNIQITIIAWLVEFLGFFVIFFGTFILPEKNPITTFTLQTFTISLYMIITPSMYLINSNHMKAIIVESNWYISLVRGLNFINNKYKKDNNNQNENNNIENENERSDPVNQVQDVNHKGHNNDRRITQKREPNSYSQELGLQSPNPLNDCELIDMEEKHEV